MAVIFWVPGNPAPKQSFRMLRAGGGYTEMRVKAWQKQVWVSARQAMNLLPPTDEAVRVELDFVLTARRRVDLDNLSKAVLDACNRVIWKDDQQVVELQIRKLLKPDAEAGVWVRVDVV